MKKDKIIFVLLVIFAIILRILFIDKPAGFWYNLTGLL